MRHATENAQSLAFKSAKRGDSPDPWAIQHEATNAIAQAYMQTYRQVVARYRFLTPVRYTVYSGTITAME
jgi:hypothetical protein